MKSTRVNAWLVALSTGLAALGAARSAAAAGESVNGFPNWQERVMHEWTNRARVDPQLEMTTCGAACGEKACYAVEGPVWYSEPLNRAARFHADEMIKQGYFAHDSQCTLVPNLSAIYPSGTDGSASTACVGGTKACNPTCTSWNGRVQLFGVSPNWEIIASPSDPDYAFYLWLYESSNNPACSWNSSNGHRWAILKATGSVGYGSSGYSVGDFTGASNSYKIPSGSHYPRQGASVEVWANWYDTASPAAARVNVDGPCTDLTLGRGSGTNGAWKANLTNVGSGCHRYYFVFVDSASNVVTFPSTGSLGIGPDSSCADWDTSRPSMGAGCGCIPQCTGKQCGDDGCTGTCGTCSGNSVCQSGQCVCVPQCGGKVCGDDGCGGSCGSCSGGTSCQAGQCVCAPDCTGKVCGDDGCGGSCGACAGGQSCQAGQCVCVPDCTGKACGDDGCGASCGACVGGQSCQAGQCVCVPQCTGVVCGDDTCGGSCGSCAAGTACQAGQCVGCTPNCTGKVCGDDTCQGSCGTCPSGHSCQAGQCVACTPDCTGKVCGDNGCAGLCGSCASGESCVQGQCIKGDASTQDVTPAKDSAVADTSQDGPKTDTGVKDAKVTDAPGKTDGKLSDGALSDGAQGDGAAGAAGGGAGDDSGCGCTTPGRSPATAGWMALLALGLLARKRRRSSSPVR